VSASARRPRRTASVRLDETRRQIEQATHQALGQIREEVGKLSLLAAEKITRKSLTGTDQSGLIDEALAEIDFSELEGAGHERRLDGAHGSGCASAPHLCASALRGGTGAGQARRACTQQLQELRAAFAESPDLAGLLENPEIESTVKATCLTRVAKGPDELLITSCG